MRILLLLSMMTISVTATVFAEAKERDLRVMTFNIRNGRANDGENRWENRRESAAKLIRELKTDLLGIQEAFRSQIDDLLKALPEYGEIGMGRDDGKNEGEHCQILYRRDRFEVEEHGTFWFSDTPELPGSKNWGNEIPRICTWARLKDRQKRKSFYFYNIHLDHQSQPSRERSAQLLLDRISRRKQADPVIITGDFNAGEDNTAIQRLKTNNSPVLRDTFRILHPEDKAVATFHGFEGGTHGDKIDFIFASDEFKAHDAAILHDNRNGRYPSDHYPVTARLLW